MTYKGYLDNQLKDPKFKKEFDKEFFIQSHINSLLISLEDMGVPYGEDFINDIHDCLEELYLKIENNNE